MFAALLLGGASGLIVGGLLFQAASVFDGVDGEIARATFRSSPAGAALDTGVDMATNLSFMLGVTINLGLSEGREAVLVGGWGFLIFAVGLILTSRLAARAAGPFSLDLLKHRYRRQFSGPIATSLISVGTVATGRDVFALVFALLIVAGVTDDRDLPLCRRRHDLVPFRRRRRSPASRGLAARAKRLTFAAFLRDRHQGVTSGGRMKKIKVALLGIGNCASSLVQGVYYYSDPSRRARGLIHPIDRRP